MLELTDNLLRRSKVALFESLHHVERGHDQLKTQPPATRTQLTARSAPEQALKLSQSKTVHVVLSEWTYASRAEIRSSSAPTSSPFSATVAAAISTRPRFAELSSRKASTATRSSNALMSCAVVRLTESGTSPPVLRRFFPPRFRATARSRAFFGW